MKNNGFDNIEHIRICPLCGQAYAGHPAISRTDNETPICADCGAREALTAFGLGSDEIEQIIAIIRRSEGRA